MGEHLFAHGAVIDAILKTIGLGGAVCVGEHCDVDHDVLRPVAFPIIDADNSTGEQIFDDDLIHGKSPFLRIVIVVKAYDQDKANILNEMSPTIQMEDLSGDIRWAGEQK